MTRFEYAAIFNGIFVALALENIASSFHKLLAAGGRVRWHWMAPTNAVGAAIATIGTFWLWWRGRDIPAVDPTVFTALVNALTLFMLYLACAATLPDDIPEAGIDLKAFYFSTRRQFFGILMATTLLLVCTAVWSMARHGFDPQYMQLNLPVFIGSLVATATFASLFLVRAVWWHALGIIALTSGVTFLYGPMKI